MMKLFFFHLRFRISRKRFSNSPCAF